MLGGYAGRLLEVNLTDGSVDKSPLDLDLTKTYIGGRGLTAKLCWDRLKPGTDPLSPYNILLFLIGPITGVFGGGKTCVGFKQPETGTIGHAIVGGQWGPELRFAGYDGIIVSGKADDPVFLFIKDDDVEIREAKHLWGKGTTETEMKIKEELGEAFIRILCCGPAGENLIRSSAIIHSSWRAAARGGGGAVMGSKNLKAVAVRGTKDVEVARPQECFDLIDDFKRRCLAIDRERYTLRRYGSTLGSLGKCDVGDMAVRNFREGDWAQIYKIGGVRLERRNVVAHASCYACPVGCFHVGVVRTGPYAGTVSQIDFDSSGLLGPNCLVEDIDGLMYLNALCDELGLDSESFGGILAWAMECYEKGILTKERLRGIDLTWGNVPAMIELIIKTTRREGIGNLLAEGFRYAPEKVGGESVKFAMHSKGMGFGGHHPVTPERGLQYAVGDRGGCHHYGNSIDEQNWRAWADSLTCCTWHQIAIGEDYAKLLNAVTGLNLVKGREDWDFVAERLLILARAFNVREGLRPLEDEVLPERVHKEPLTYGKGKGRFYPQEEFEKDRAAWYKTRGCNEKGIPTREHLKELGLSFVIPEFERIGVYE